MQTTKSLKYWQWRTIIVTMIGYAMFYLVRKNFSFSMPGLQADFGITKTQLGIFLTLHGVIYGLSRFVVGIITDRNSARKVMSLGLMLCAIVNLLVVDVRDTAPAVLNDGQLILLFHNTILFLIEQSASLCHRGFWLLGWRPIGHS